MNVRGRAGRAVAWGGLVAVLAVAAGWWWVAPPGATVLPDVRGAVGAEPATAEPSVHEPARSGAGTSDREVAPTGEPQRTQTLRVVDELGAPVAGAFVAVAPRLPKSSARAPFVDVEAAFADQPRVRSDTDGRVWLPGAAFERYVLVRHDSRFGCGELRFDPSLPEPELAIAPACDLTVRVVGPDGAPRADVPVDVSWCSYRSPFAEHPSVARLRSGPQGLLRVWHAQALSHWDREPTIELVARVLGADGEPVRVPLREAGGIVELRCPAHGTLRVQPTLADGSPCPWPSRCEVRAVDDPEGRWSGTIDPGVPATVAVALAREWRVERDGSGARSVRGPVVDGEQSVVPVVGAARLAMARLVWPDGSAVVGRTVSIAVGSSWWKQGVTEGDGTMLFPAPEPKWGVQFSTNGPVARGAATMPEADASDRTVDLGEVVLHPDAVMVRGEIVDAVTRTPVDAHFLASGPTGYSGIASTFCLWLDGADARGDVTIHASRAGYRSAQRTVPCGATDLRIELQREPWLTVTVLADDDVFAAALTIARSVGAPWRPLAHREQRGRIVCTFPLAAGDLGADDFAVLVRGGQRGPELARAPVAAWRGDAGGHAIEFDLRGRVANVAALPRADGRSVALQRWFLRERGGDGSWWEADGIWHVGFARPGTQFDAIAVPRGAFPARASVTTGANALELPPAATVAVQVDGWPDGIDGRVVLWQRTWAEPLLRELVDAGVLAADLAPRELPGDAAAWRRRRDPGDAAFDLPGARGDLAAARRGRYLVVPCAVAAYTERPLLDVAVEVDVTTPGQRLDVQLRVDPERVRAAARGD